jgi:hypothetical protein
MLTERFPKCEVGVSSFLLRGHVYMRNIFKILPIVDVVVIQYHRIQTYLPSAVLGSK